MELNEKFNNSYTKEKKAFKKLEKVQKQIQSIENNLKVIRREITVAENEKQWAQEDNDKNQVKIAEDKIKNLKEQEEKLKEDARALKEIVDKQKGKVDKYFEEIENNPELKAHVNKIMEKQYNRKLKKAKETKRQTELLQKTIEEHPTVENYIKGMIRAQEEIEKFTEELKTLDPVADKAKIDRIENVEMPTLESKYEKNKGLIKDSFTKNKIDISVDFIEELVKGNKFSHYTKKEKGKDGKVVSTDEINVSKTLKNLTKRNNREIALYEKTIGKIPGAVIYEDKGKNEGDEPGKSEKSEKTSKIKSLFSRSKEKEEIEENTEEKSLTNPKRSMFDWIRHPIESWKSKKQERAATKAKEKAEKQAKTSKASEKFRSAYKYDVVKDYVERESSKMEKEAYNEMKSKRAEKIPAKGESER